MSFFSLRAMPLFLAALLAAISHYPGTEEGAVTHFPVQCQTTQSQQSLPPGWEQSLKMRESSYLISNTDDLLLMRQLIALGMEFPNGMRAQDAHWLLTNDLDLADICREEEGGWKPIGTFLWGNVPDEQQAYAFRGVFDGGNHTISGLSIYRPEDDAKDSGSSMFQGLFGYVCDGEIRNLVMQDCRITGGTVVGAVAGGCWGIEADEGCKIINCTVSGTISTLGGGAGGVVGVASLVKDCGFSGTVTNPSGKAVSVGGVAGRVREISTSRALGDVIGRESVGGVAGDCLRLQSCYAIGSVTGYRYVGGVAGQGAAITGSYCASIVAGHESAGGIAGRVGPLAGCETAMLAENCMAGPAVAVILKISGEPQLAQGVGRIVGAVDSGARIGETFARADMTLDGRAPPYDSADLDGNNIAFRLLGRGGMWEKMLLETDGHWEAAWKPTQNGMYPQLSWETGPALPVS